MKHIFSVFVSLMMLTTAIAATTIETPASDSRFTFVGRTLVQQGDVSFDWSGVYARLRFEGNYLAMRVSDTHKNYYNVWIDSPMSAPADKVVATFGQDSIVELVTPEDLKAKYGKRIPKEHKVVIQKRTEGEQGTTTVHAFLTNDCVLQAEPLKERMIEFVGDSYTCGYGTEGANAKERWRPETENVNYAYEFILSRYFDADVYVVAHSGMGIARNYADKFDGWWMPDRYKQTFDMQKDTLLWDASKSDFRPAMTVVLLGANDFSSAKQPSIARWKSQYGKLLAAIKANYGEDYPILCCAPKSNTDVFPYVREMVQQCGLKNVHYMGWFEQVFLYEELGSDFHPNYQGHRKYAHGIVPYISTLTGWPISDELK